MKVIIAGSRNFHHYPTLVEVIQESQFNITEVVSGGANGVDRLGEKFAEENGIKLTIIRANWEKYGKSAGYRMNVEMAEYVCPDGGLIAIRRNNSRGTTHMIEIAKKMDLHVYGIDL